MASPRERLEYLRSLKAQQSGSEAPRQKLERLRAEKQSKLAAIPKEERAQQLLAETPADVPLPQGFEQYDTRGKEKPEYSLGEKVLGAGETALTVLTGATGGMAGQLYGTGKGLVESISSGKFGTQEGAKLVQEEAMKQASELTYEPRTEAGKSYVKSLAETAAPLAAIPSVQGEITALSAFAKPTLKQVSVEAPRIANRMIKDMVAEDLKAAKANPAIGRTIKQIGMDIDSGKIETNNLPAVINDIKGSIVNEAGASTFEKLSKITDDIAAGNKGASKELIVFGDDVSQAAANKKLVKYMLNGAGKSEKDPLSINAAKQGFDPGVVTAVKGSTAEDKSKMMKMLSVMKDITENKRKALDMRPSDVAGDSLLDRYKYVSKINKAAGDKLDSVAKALKGKYADFNEPINNFMNKLDDMGITLDENLNPIFAKSDIEGFKPAEFAVKKIVERLKAGERGEVPTAYDMHRLKRFIDNNVDYGVEGTGLTGDVQRIVKALRHDIDTVLDDNFKQYNKVNTQYSDTIKVLKGMQETAGKKLDFEGVGAESALGTKLRGLMSNIQSRQNLKNSIDDLQAIAEKYGAKYNDDIGMQMLFADELDSRFSPVARTSLGGEFAKFTDKMQPPKRKRDYVYGAAKKAGEFVMGDEEERAFKAMQELLKRRQ